MMSMLSVMEYQFCSILLWHSTIEMTLNVYRHVNNDYKQKMADKINDFSN